MSKQKEETITWGNNFFVYLFLTFILLLAICIGVKLVEVSGDIKSLKKEIKKSQMTLSLSDTEKVDSKFQLRITVPNGDSSVGKYFICTQYLSVEKTPSDLPNQKKHNPTEEEK